MFYSHDILTSREHGVATVWLVATLGSAAKKVNRKAILGVDVPRACDTIMHPEAPMALRLQGNLLYGVSRVYNQQCVYTLTDVQAMHDKMRTTFKIFRDAGLDPEAGKAKPDQLIVPHDPAFMPELSLPGLDLDFANLDISTEDRPNLYCSLLSTPFTNSSNSPLMEKHQISIDISSPTIVAGHIRDVGATSRMGSARHETAFKRASIFDDEEGVVLQPDFEFDEEGNIIELNKKEPQDQAENLAHVQREHHIGEEARKNLEARFLQSAEPMDLDKDNELLIGGDLDILPPGEPFPKRGRIPDPDYRSTSESHKAPLQPKKRSIKCLQMDVPQELRNADLAKWDNEYLYNMASSRQSNYKLITRAKKNAAFWVFGHGIGSVGQGLGVSQVTHPLHNFSGEHLLAALHERKERNVGQKRSYQLANESDSSDDERRVRARDKGEYEATAGRGKSRIFAESDGQVQEDVEIGRHAPLSLHDDASSQMPWNITLSIQGSRHGSSAPSLPGPFDSVDSSSRRQLVGLGRIGHRLASSSPLASRGLLFDPSRLDRRSFLSIFGNESDDLDTLGDFTLDSYYGEEHIDDVVGAEPESRSNQALQSVGPNAMDPKAVAAFQLRVSTLDQDSKNFLEFVNNGVRSLSSEQAPAAAISNNEITFSRLLPPETTSRAVATQGLMHILTLTTRDILTVRQVWVSHGLQDTFGDIILSMKVAS